MGVFFIDTEFNNGNFYLGDIFEIACLSSNNRLFHTYINIQTDIPVYIQRMCGLNTSLIKQAPYFNEAMDNLIKFISLDEDYKTQTILIGHGGRLSDYPLLLANCIKNRYDYNCLKNYKFVDSMEGFRESGYRRPGLDSLLSYQRNIHSAKEDVQLLRNIVTSHKNIRYKLFTYNEIFNHLCEKMPVTISDIRKQVKTKGNLEQYLRKYVKEKTALNRKQLWKIVNRYSFE